MKFINWPLKNKKEPQITYKCLKLSKSNLKETSFSSKTTAPKNRMTFLNLNKMITDLETRKPLKKPKITLWKKRIILKNLKIAP
jgi:hypothetical protein